jgi:hypothetical protein
MKQLRCIVSISLLLAVLTSCDFPSDPPLITADNSDTPTIMPNLIRDLLPLAEGVQWIYIVTPRSRPAQLPVSVSPRELSFNGEKYYYLRYGTVMGPSGPMNAFPSFLRNDSTGLEFYLPVDPRDTLSIGRTPKHVFTLPYPARPGGWNIAPKTEYAVRLTHVDTLINVYNTSIQLRCHRYEVGRNSLVLTTFYIVPGVCILRIEDDDMVFHTVAWQID